MRNVVQTREAPLPVGAYSQGVVYRDIILTAGQIGVDPSTGELALGLRRQTELSLSNLENILLEAGSGLDMVLKVTAYITDMSEFATLNQIYSEHFQAPYPARSVVEVSSLPLGALVEIEAIAVLRRETT